MKFRHQIILFALLPFLVLGIVALAVYVASNSEHVQRESIGRTYKDSKDAELKNYCAMATKAIAHLYELGRTDTVTIERAKKDAQALLARLDYGPDGYFFLYDFQGRLLMHPRQPELVGEDLGNRRIGKDGNSILVIQDLISTARHGGGLVDYWWSKPSTHTDVSVRKRACVVALDHWGWVLGTGMYIDDIDATLAELETQASWHFSYTMAGMVVLSLIVGALDIFLVLNIRALRTADAKLRTLARRIIQTQDDERDRIAKGLHDSVKPELVSLKMQIIAGIHRLQRLSQQPTLSPAIFEEAAGLVDKALKDIDRVVKDLHPSDLDDFGLSGALHTLADRFTHSGWRIEVHVVGDTEGLSPAIQKAVFLVAQEALANAAKHSTASRASIRMERDARTVTLTVQNNGHGFNVAAVHADPDRGLGLRNMEERIEAEGGQFHLTSSLNETTIIATIPLHDAKGVFHGDSPPADPNADR